MILVFGKVSKSLLFLCLAVNFSYCLSCGLAQPQFLPPSHCLSCIRSQISFRLLAYWKVLKAWTVLKKKKKLLSGIWQWIHPDFKLFHFSWGSLNLVVISNLALCSLSQLFLEKPSCNAIIIIMLVTLLYNSLSDCGECMFTCMSAFFWHIVA